jgi:type I restriction enzyme M protein
MLDFIKLYADKETSENSWTININSLDENFDLSVKNPNVVEVESLKNSAEILDNIKELDDKNNQILQQIAKLL